MSPAALVDPLQLQNRNIDALSAVSFVGNNIARLLAFIRLGTLQDPDDTAPAVSCGSD